MRWPWLYTPREGDRWVTLLETLLDILRCFLVCSRGAKPSTFTFLHRCAVAMIPNPHLPVLLVCGIGTKLSLCLC